MVKKRGRVFVLGPLVECRAAFAKCMQQAVAWPNPGAEWEIVSLPEPIYAGQKHGDHI